MEMTPRLQSLAEAELDEESLRVRDSLIAGPRGGVIGPFVAWLRCPELAEVADRFGSYCRFRPDADAKLRELVIMTVASHTQATFEWEHHYPLALRAGLTDSQLAAVKRREGSAGLPEKYEVAYLAVLEMLRTHRLTDTLYAAVRRHLGEKGAVDLVGTVAYYLFVSLTLNVFRIGEAP